MHFYRNGNYTVCIKDDGTKIRRTDEEEFVPQFSENIDVKLTSKCRIGCNFCYEGCTKDGKHGELFKYPFIRSLHHYTEMAINGNDMDHPDLERFLMRLKKEQVFVNMTVHQLQFVNNFNIILSYVIRGLLHGIGISYSHYDRDFFEKVQAIPNAVIHAINGILSPVDLDNLKGHDLKLLILGYKDLGRGHDFLDRNSMVVKEMQHVLYNMLPKIISENWFKCVSFDNLAIEQLDVRRLMTEEEWKEFYMGDDGKYTFYIDMVEGKFAKNSLSQERFDIGDKTIDEMFNIIRNNENEKTNQKEHL